MNLTIALPQYDAETLRTCTNTELIENMIRDEDRVPRNVIDECARRGEQILDWAAQLAANNEEDWDYRLCTANTLLDFPRERYRELLETLAAEQSGFGVHFNKNDIDRAYRKNKDQPEWDRFSDPWHFYNPQEIESRQRRWQEELIVEEKNNREFDDLLTGNPDYHYHEPYHRETPKIGRNDLCHCGSGKKYKKCCLNKEQEMLH